MTARWIRALAVVGLLGVAACNDRRASEATDATPVVDTQLQQAVSTLVGSIILNAQHQLPNVPETQPLFPSKVNEFEIMVQ